MTTPVIIHSFNPDGAQRMANELRDHNVHLAPFGSAAFKRLLYLVSRKAA